MSMRDAISILKLDEPPFAGRVGFLTETDRSVLEEIQFGILFVMAFWSGTSLQSFARLKKCLSNFDPNSLLEVVVVDTDGCPDLYEVPELLGKMHGNGEAAWIQEGQIMTIASFGSAPDIFEAFTTQLLMRRSTSVSHLQNN